MASSTIRRYKRVMKVSNKTRQLKTDAREEAKHDGRN
jgi:hypothetical protein